MKAVDEQGAVETDREQARSGSVAASCFSVGRGSPTGPRRGLSARSTHLAACVSFFCRRILRLLNFVRYRGSTASLTSRANSQIAPVRSPAYFLEGSPIRFQPKLLLHLVASPRIEDVDRAKCALGIEADGRKKSESRPRTFTTGSGSSSSRTCKLCTESAAG